MKHVLTGMLFSIIIFSVAVLVMEVRDGQFRGYVHTVPGAETFRHVYYEPGREYVLGVYQQLSSGGRSRGWFK